MKRSEGAALADMLISSPGLFDGLALASGCLCLFMVWAFGVAHRKTDAAGAGFMAAAMLMGGIAWIGSATFGSFSDQSRRPADLVVAIAALFGVCSLIVGYCRYVSRGQLRWKTLFLLALLWSISGLLFQHLGGPPWSPDLMVSLLLVGCSIYSVRKFFRHKDPGYLLMVAAFLIHPATLVSALALDLDLERVRQLLGLPYLVLGLMVFSVAFFRNHAHTLKQIVKLEAFDAELRALVYTDAVTGLRSAHGQRERMAALLDARVSYALFCINLDDFRLVNDNLGPVGGNAVIASAARVIQNAVGDRGEVARSSGAEFTVLMPGDVVQRDLLAMAQRMQESMATPLHYGQTSLLVGLSIGIASCPQDATDVDEILRIANVAVHEVKAQGGGGICSYTPAMDETAHQHLWLDNNLRAALELKQFELHYQPKLQLAERRATSVEALIRWKHPERGNIRPDQFIERAEVSGQIVAIGRWVIQAAALQASRWLEQGLEIRVAVNISVKQLSDATLLDSLRDAQATAGGMLDLELTESCLAGNEKETLTFITECRAMGYGVHLDDFGTGYSSLSRLGNLPLTMIKLDRAFITPIGKSDKANALVRAMVSVAKELQLQVVAEGVETIEQADYLKQLGVGYVQGWLYAPAMAVEKCEAWFAANWTKAPPVDDLPTRSHATNSAT
jgi:diguanylate cyclase (GGDEF)-like protein